MSSLLLDGVFRTSFCEVVERYRNGLVRRRGLAGIACVAEWWKCGRRINGKIGRMPIWHDRKRCMLLCRARGSVNSRDGQAESSIRTAKTKNSVEVLADSWPIAP